MYPLLEGISSDEEDLPKKKCRAPEIIICEPDVVEDPDIIYLGIKKTSPPEIIIREPDVEEDPDIIYLGTKKTSPRAPPNSPTYPSLSVPQSSNIWLEGTSVYPVQVMF